MFKIGEKVAALNSTESGRVAKIDGSKVTVRDGDGFDIIFEASELVSRESFDVSFSSFDATKNIGNFLRDEKYASKRPQPSGKKHMGDAPIIVDLHIEKLLSPSKTAAMTSGDIVDYQLRHAKTALANARKAGKHRVILIHGVGEGVLHGELGYTLRGMPRLRFFDAAFNRYGHGATEVELF